MALHPLHDAIYQTCWVVSPKLLRSWSIAHEGTIAHQRWQLLPWLPFMVRFPWSLWDETCWNLFNEFQWHVMTRHDTSWHVMTRHDTSWHVTVLMLLSDLQDMFSHTWRFPFATLGPKGIGPFSVQAGRRCVTTPVEIGLCQTRTLEIGDFWYLLMHTVNIGECKSSAFPNVRRCESSRLSQAGKEWFAKAPVSGWV